MPNIVNRLMLQEYKERYQDAENLIAIGYEGLDVEATNVFRGELEKNGMSMKLVKNRIVRRAFEELGIDGVESILTGQTAFVAGGDPVAMARTIRDFGKTHEQVVFRGAIVEKTVLGEAEAKGLADAASKEELQARVVSAALSGGANIAGALTGPSKKVAGCIKSLIEKLEKESA